MTPLLPTPDHYIYNLITMTSSEAKRLWSAASKEHFGCTCVYCGETYELHELTLTTSTLKRLVEDITSNLVPCCKSVIRTKEVTIGSRG
ncbi:MAG: hypothetical protein CM15mV135_250 [uncultured marine virus]|nr:MAG: hypothetical protein CM15mV135_250 [uncultured marine virus]